MKRSFIVIALVAVVLIATISCTHHTCPAYRGSIADASVVE